MIQLDTIINAAKSAQYGSTHTQYEAIAAAVIRAAAMRTLLTAEEHEGSTPSDYELGWNAAVDYLQSIAYELEVSEGVSLTGRTS